jgi:NitT/TauT family transport system substrate-binding protein
VSRMRPLLVLTVALSLVLAACSTTGGASPVPSSPSVAPSAAPSVAPSTGASAAASPSTAATPTKLAVGLGYIPSVQFAPFYLAEQQGWYDEAGLDVTFQNEIDTNLIPKLGQGNVDVGIADGTDVIPAVSQGIPIKYLATIYGQFPSIVFSKQSAGIDSAAKLKGKKLGIPGKYGSSWAMLQALLKSASLTPDDLQVIEYPDFGQGAAVAAGAVDAATGFANNEPVQLQLAGTPTTVLHVDGITPLPGPGLIAGAKTLETKADAIKAFVAVTLRAMGDIAANPTHGIDAAVAAVPELGSDRATQAAILDATIASWTGPVQQAKGLGALDPDGWAKSIEYLTSLGSVANAVTVQDVLAEGYVPGT